MPSLLHGDLWGGNWGAVDGEPVIFDPAVYYGDREAEAIYKRSVSLMLYEACTERYPAARLVIGQSLGNSYHYEVRGDHPPLEEMAPALEQRMRELHREHRTMVRRTVTLEEIENHFRRHDRQDKLSLLATRRSSTVHTLSCGEFIDLGTFVGDPPEHLDPALLQQLLHAAPVCRRYRHRLAHAHVDQVAQPLRSSETPQRQGLNDDLTGREVALEPLPCRHAKAAAHATAHL